MLNNLTVMFFVKPLLTFTFVFCVVFQVAGTVPGITVTCAGRTPMLSASCALTLFARLTRRGRCGRTRSWASSAARNMKTLISALRRRPRWSTTLKNPHPPNHASTGAEQRPQPAAKNLSRRGPERPQMCSGILNYGSCLSSN